MSSPDDTTHNYPENQHSPNEDMNSPVNIQDREVKLEKPTLPQPNTQNSLPTPQSLPAAQNLPNSPTSLPTPQSGIRQNLPTPQSGMPTPSTLPIPNQSVRNLPTPHGQPHTMGNQVPQQHAGYHSQVPSGMPGAKHSREDTNSGDNVKRQRVDSSGLPGLGNDFSQQSGQLPPQPNPNQNQMPDQEKAMIFFHGHVIPLVHVRFNTLEEFKTQLCMFLNIPQQYNVELFREDNNEPITTIEEKRQTEGIIVNLSMKTGFPQNNPYPNNVYYPNQRYGGYGTPKQSLSNSNLYNDPAEIQLAIETNENEMAATLPSSKTPVMDAFIYCALCRWGVMLHSSDSRNVTFSFTHYDELWSRSRQVCSKRTPTHAEVSRLKALRRWFCDLPGFKDLKAVKPGSQSIIVRVKDDRVDKISTMIKKMNQVLNARVKSILNEAPTTQYGQ